MDPLDHHKLILMMMKSGIIKQPAKTTIFQAYTLREELETLEDDKLGEFEKKLANVLNIYAPIKTKMIRCNNSVFMTKELRKYIMKRSKLRNKFNRNDENCCNFKLHKLLCKHFKESEK